MESENLSKDDRSRHLVAFRAHAHGAARHPRLTPLYRVKLGGENQNSGGETMNTGDWLVLGCRKKMKQASGRGDALHENFSMAWGGWFIQESFGGAANK